MSAALEVIVQPQKSDLLKRTTTAVVLIITTFSILLYGNQIIKEGAVFFLYFLALKEWGQLSLSSFKKGMPLISFLCMVSARLIVEIPDFDGINTMHLAFGMMMLSLLAAVINKEWIYSLGFCYISIGFAALLHYMESAMLLNLLWIFGTVWLADIFAYIVGRSIGGLKLCPSISPGKTWSGLVGGLVVPVLAMGYFASMHDIIQFPYIATFLLAGASHLGDVLESLCKRYYHVKDSGALLPGHGGILDRIDGLICSLIVSLILLYFV